MIFILAQNPETAAVQLVGTTKGEPFKTEQSAGRQMVKLQKKFPNVVFLVMPVENCPSLPRVSTIGQTDGKAQHDLRPDAHVPDAESRSTDHAG